MYFSLLSPHIIHTMDHSDNNSFISYILTNLDGYTNYSCAVSACTSVGCSAYSQSIVFITNESGLY